MRRCRIATSYSTNYMILPQDSCMTAFKLKDYKWNDLTSAIIITIFLSC